VNNSVSAGRVGVDAFQLMKMLRKSSPVDSAILYRQSIEQVLKEVASATTPIATDLVNKVNILMTLRHTDMSLI
jgi:hypothetical protein